MKATGIVRRIDDLGRVVIPKEIRRTMRIREGDPLEIFTSNGEVIFKKYSPIGELSPTAVQYAEAMIKHTTSPVIICDRDHCIAVGGGLKKNLLEKAVSSDLEKICEERKTFINRENKEIFALDGVNKKICTAVPVIAAGDIIGCVVLLENETSTAATEHDVKLAEVASRFLSSRSE